MKDGAITDKNALFADPDLRARMANIDQVNCKSYDELVTTNNNNANAIEQGNSSFSLPYMPVLMLL